MSSDEEDNYVPRSPEYITNSPGPQTETEDQNPGHNINGSESGPSRRTVQVPSNDNEDRPDLLWVEVTSYKEYPISKRTGPFQKTTGENKTNVNTNM